MCCKNDPLLNPALYSPVVLSPVFSLFPPVDQSMFENSIAQQQSPQTSRPGQTSARRSTASANPNLGSSSVDSPSSGGQQRLKNAINLGKAVGAKVSAEQVLSSARPHSIYSSENLSYGVTLLMLKWSSFMYLLKNAFHSSCSSFLLLSLSFLFFCLFFIWTFCLFLPYFLSFFLLSFYLFLPFFPSLFLHFILPSLPPFFFIPSSIPFFLFSVCLTFSPPPSLLPSFLPSFRSMTC